ncbi:MAG: hypothetical protein ACFFB3_04775 [Candidatus Hodarchaeota archaeon]
MKKVLLALGFLFVLVSVGPQVVAAEKDNSCPIIDITDAYYAELDNDNLEDDIAVHLDIKATNRNQSFYICLEIILPSGTAHTKYFFIDIYDRKFNIRIEAHNVATESGWYETRVYLAMPIPATPNPSAACWRLELYDVIIFDPPGKGGADPLFWAMFYC